MKSQTKKLFTVFVFMIISIVAKSQVGIGTTSPDASAKLDISSTTQGLLPPRMTYAQRQAISSPATGLIIYCTNCGPGIGEPQFYNGTAWVNMSQATTIVGGFTHYLGEAFNGGIIYYLYKGSDNLEHGLVVALTESTGAWQTSPTLVNANRTEDGAYNTNLMTGSPAASYIATLGAGWYLPSIDELALLYYNRYNAQKGLRGGGNTLLSKDAFYWSSTEYWSSGIYSDDVASGFAFLNGTSFNDMKTTIFNLRGVKAF